MDEFTPCASANCSACAEVKRLRAENERMRALHDKDCRQRWDAIAGRDRLRESLDREYGAHRDRLHNGHTCPFDTTDECFASIRAFLDGDQP